MTMKRISITLAIAAMGTAAIAQTYDFEVKIENLGPQAVSPLFWAAGNENFDIFQLGGMSSAGIKAIAEGGDTAPMSAIATAAGSDVFAFGTLAGGPLMPGNMQTGMFTTDLGHGFFSFAAMLGQTNDGFIGESYSTSGLSLFSLGQPQGFSMLITGLRAWDAGTELNSQNSADLGFLGGSGNPADSNQDIRIHDSIVPGVGNSWQQMPDWDLSTPLVRVTLTPVPEPATMVALGLAAVAVLRKKRK